MPTFASFGLCWSQHWQGTAMTDRECLWDIQEVKITLIIYDILKWFFFTLMFFPYFIFMQNKNYNYLHF
jgi:hypothetical protein